MGKKPWKQGNTLGVSYNNIILQILKILNRLSKRNKVIRLDTRSTEDNSTALHIAARKGFTKLVEWLLEKHASPYTRNKLRQTPLEVAIQEKHDETAEVLVKKMRKERYDFYT